MSIVKNALSFYASFRGGDYRVTMTKRRYLPTSNKVVFISDCEANLKDNFLFDRLQKIWSKDKTIAKVPTLLLV